jgi:hypothetical protein
MPAEHEFQPGNLCGSERSPSKACVLLSALRPSTTAELRSYKTNLSAPFCSDPCHSLGEPKESPARITERGSRAWCPRGGREQRPKQVESTKSRPTRFNLLRLRRLNYLPNRLFAETSARTRSPGTSGTSLARKSDRCSMLRAAAYNRLVGGSSPPSPSTQSCTNGDFPVQCDLARGIFGTCFALTPITTIAPERTCP